ncbi:MAG: AraC family transcriptional regulator [Muribaculaceae bacterium]|nr:AraC family transcriptional regulator [Muribaculaceae bacterium]
MLKIKEGFRGEKSYILPPAAVALMEEHPLSAILHITDIGYYPRAANHYRERFTPLKVNVFIYCVAGEGWYYVDGHRYQVGPDTFFILPAGLAHSYGASDDNPWTIYWIHFGGTLASEYMPESPSPIEIKPGQSSRIASRIDIFEEIMATLDIALDREHLLYACSVFHHFLGSLRFLQQYRSAGSIADGHDVISRTIRYMNENVSKPMRLDQLAEYAGYSKSQFSTLFRQATGSSPIDYFNRLKMKYACRLLEGTSLNINNICHKVGIPDPYYFSRLFKSLVGKSPQAYRSGHAG